MKREGETGGNYRIRSTKNIFGDKYFMGGRKVTQKKTINVNINAFFVILGVFNHPAIALLGDDRKSASWQKCL